jgi:hypothetical protein
MWRQRGPPILWPALHTAQVNDQRVHKYERMRAPPVGGSALRNAGKKWTHAVTQLPEPLASCHDLRQRERVSC